MILDETYYFFKGKRSYLHSTEIFNSIVSVLPVAERQDIDFSLSIKMTNRWSVSAKKPTDKSTITGHFKTISAKYYIIDTLIPVIERRAYDETPIENVCSIKDDSITIPLTCQGFSLIERIVSGYKTLLNNSIYPTEDKKYFFMRVTLNYLPTKDVTIQFKRRFAKRFLEADIISEDTILGKIYFLDD